MRYSIIILCVLITGNILAQNKTKSKINKDEIVPGQYVVKFKHAADLEDFNANNSKLNFKVIESKQAFKSSRVSANSRKDKSGVDLSRYYFVQTGKSEAPENVISGFSSLDMVEYIEPIFKRKVAALPYTPNDASIGNQTFLEAIKAFDAWSITKGSEDIVIAIVDAGVDYEHEDLADKIYLNVAEIPDNGIDDDNDGYIDNYYGWDFAGPDLNNISEDNDPIAKGANIDHGTFVSGCAAANTDNEIGIAGVGFNVKYMALKCSPENDETAPGGSAYLYNTISAVLYAAEHGADVINMSYGGSGYSQFEQDIFTYAALEMDVVLVAAAGNDGEDLAQYPAQYDHVISVAATNDNDVKASFSNFGSWVDMAAPGVSIYSTNTNSRYGPISGTSFSSPIVAGAAGLLRSFYPDYNQFQISQLLIQTGDDISNINANNSQIGLRLNIYNALTKSTPAVRFDSVSVINDNGQIPLKSEKAYVYLNLVNELDPTSSSTTVTIVEVTDVGVVFDSDTLLSVGEITSGQSFTFNQAFSFVMPSDIGQENVIFELIIQDTITGFKSRKLIRSILNPVDFDNFPRLMVPYTNDFESNLDDFFVENISGSRLQLGKSSIGGKSGTTSGDNAWVLGIDESNYQDASKNYLYTPIFDFSLLGEYILTFQTKYSFEEKWDGFIVDYSMDLGDSWMQLNPNVEEGWYDVISENNTDDPNTVWKSTPIFSGTTNNRFVLKTVNLSDLSGNDQIGFRFHIRTDLASTDVGMVIDDFELTGPVGGLVVPSFSYEVNSGSFGCEGVEMIFKNESTGSVANLSWDFGANATPTSAEGVGPHTVTFDTAGEYVVVLTATDSQNSTTTKTSTVSISTIHTPNINQTVDDGGVFVIAVTDEADAYQWYLNDEAIDGATSQSYTSNIEGFYTVDVTQGSCVISASIEPVITALVEDQSMFSIYPNPIIAGGQISIAFRKQLSEPVVIRMMDATGRLLLESQTNTSEGLLSFEISSKAKGIYFISITSEYGQTIEKLIVK